VPSGTIETPILIVGAGPVGLALAADLGARGVRCLVIEQGEGTTDHPRASALNARSMEFLRRWGVAEAVREAGTPADFPHTALYCTTLTGFEIARIERPHHGGRQPSATSLRYRWRFEELAEEGERVIATAHDLALDERRRIAAGYVV